MRPGRESKGKRGGPVGIETLAASISEERDTLEDVCEPFLLQVGIIARALEKGYPMSACAIARWAVSESQ